MTDIIFPKCAAKYCRQMAAAGKKYCLKHEGMTGGEIIKAGKLEELVTIKLEAKTIELLVNYALEDLAKRAK